MKKIKIVLLMMALFMTVPTNRVLVSATSDSREEIRNIFSNPSTAKAVAFGFAVANHVPVESVGSDYRISQSELDSVMSILYNTTRPISFVDPDLVKLNGLKNLEFDNSSLSDLSGIEVLSDRLSSLVMESPKVTDLEPLKHLGKLKTLKIVDASDEANMAIESNDDFFKPIKDLSLRTLVLDRVKINNNHTVAISEISSLAYLSIAQANLTEFKNISKMVNLETLDVSNNKLTRLEDFHKLVNLKIFYGGNNYSEINYNQIIDFSDIVFPITSSGGTIANIHFGDNENYLPLTIEYQRNALGEYIPLYYFDLNKIKLPQSSPGYNDIKMEVTMNENGKTLDLVNNRLIIDKNVAESQILDPITGEYVDFKFKVGSYKFLIPGYKDGLVHQGTNILGVNSIEIIGDVPESKKVKVDLIYNNGQSVVSLSVNHNVAMSEPVTPVYGTNVFEGWYIDSEFKTRWNFSDPVINDMTLYAKWSLPVEEKFYTVSFESNNGTLIPDIRVGQNKLILQPKHPLREGFIFDGWYLDSRLEELYDFSTLVTSDMTLFAKWKSIDNIDETEDKEDIEVVEVLHKFMFKSQGGSNIATQYILDGERATLPKVPSKEGYKFIGWYEDKDYKVEYKFSDLVHEDKVVYAKWELVNGVLPSTGVSNSTSIYALLLVIIGSGIVVIKKNKKNVIN